MSKPPTFKEMREYMEVTSNQTIDDLLSKLKEEGYLKNKKGKPRGLFVTRKGFPSGEALKSINDTLIPTKSSLSVYQAAHKFDFQSNSSNVSYDTENQKVTGFSINWQGGTT